MNCKACKLCGELFSKQPKHSRKQFEARKYCGMKCSLKDSGFTKGHNIRKPSRITPLQKKRIIEAYRNGLPNKEIINKFTISNTHLHRLLREKKIKNRNVFGLRLKKNCQHCSKIFERTPYFMKNNNKKGCSFCSKACADTFKRGKSLEEFFGKEKADNVRNTIIRRIQNGELKQSHTKPERVFKEALLEAGLKEGEDFIHQHRIGYYLFDFAFPKTKTIIEVHGDFWHANPAKFPHNKKTFMMSVNEVTEKPLYSIQIKNIKKDIKKRELAMKKGWKYSFIWESDIYEISFLKSAIKSILKDFK